MRCVADGIFQVRQVLQELREPQALPVNVDLKDILVYLDQRESRVNRDRRDSAADHKDHQVGWLVGV